MMVIPDHSAREKLLQRYGRCYGTLGLAVSWTDGIEGFAAKTARHWQTRPDRLPDEAFAAALFRRGLSRNPVVSLKASNLIGVDVDGEAGRSLVQQLIPGGLPETVSVETGRADGGHHYWYRPPQGDWPAKIEFSGDGLELIRDGYLVIPPALHGDTGRPYRFTAGRAPWEHEIATLPAALLEALSGHDRTIDNTERADDSAPVPSGRRHRHLRRLAGAMRRVGAGEQTIAAALLVENELRCMPPKPERLVRDLAHDIVNRYPPGVKA